MLKLSEKISVIVPCYNVEQYIETTLKSICNQTYDNLEIILIDDGSTDCTGKILDEYEKKDSRIKVFHQKNRGQSAARNEGIRMASASYISFIDADDFIDHDFYERLYSNLMNFSADIAICGTKIYRNGKLFGLLPPYWSKSTSLLYEKINLLRGGGMCDKLYKTSIIKENNIFFDEGKFYEGNSFLMECCFYSNVMVFVPDTFYNYWIRENSTTTKKDKSHLQKLKKDRLYFITVMKKFAKEHHFDKRSKESMLRLIGRSVLDVDDISLFTLFRYLGPGLLTAKGEKWVIKHFFHLCTSFVYLFAKQIKK